MKATDVLTNLNATQTHLVEEYFSQFHDPDIDEMGQKCNACGDYSTGTLGVANFTAPIIIGSLIEEGTCYECGHPFRFVHHIPGVGKLEGYPVFYKNRVRL